MKKKVLFQIVLTVIVLAAIGASIAWKLGDNKTILEEKARQSQVRNEAIPVKARKVGLGAFQGGFEVYGEFKPYRQLAFSAEVPGKLVQLLVDNGSVVKAGQLLAEQDGDLLRNELALARLQAQQAERDLERYRNASQSGGVTQLQVDQAALALEAQKSRIATLEKQISQTRLTAPIAGTISRRNVERGSYVNPGTPLFDIVDTERLRFQAYLTSAQVTEVHPGDVVDIIPDLFPEQRLRGRISLIDVQPDAANNYLTELIVDNSGRQRLRPGMKATAHFPGKGVMQALAVPATALVGSMRDARVFVLDETTGVARLQAIRVGMTQDSLLQVLEGLQAGQWVITAGQINLEDGTAVVAEKSGQQ